LITVDNTTYTKVIFNKNNTSVVATVQIAPSTGSTVSPAIKVYNAADVEQTNWTGPTPSALQVGNAYTGIVQAGWYLLVKNEGAVAVFDSATQAVFSVTAQAESEHIVTPIKQNLESWYIVQNGNAFSDTTDDLRWNLAGAGTVLKNNSASTFAGLQSTSNMIYASDTGALTKFSASKPCKVIINFSATSGNTGSLFIKKNGSRVAYGSTYASGYAYLVSTTLDLNGTTDYFTLEANSLYTSAPDPTHLSILAIASDSTALGALPVDPPVAIYTTNAGQSIPNNAVTIVDFEDKIEDNYGMCTTGASFKCTAKRDGLYNICANIAFDGIQYTAGNASYIAFYKNNTLAVIPEYKVIETTVSQTRSVGGCAIIRLSVGDYLDVRTSNNRTAGATSLSTLAAFNRINITRLGN
jgi:hypothetical protein